MRIELPELHPGQRRIRGALKRFNVARMGRRWGKTTFGLDYLIGPEVGEPGLLAGMPCGWFAPTNKLLAEAWRESKIALRPVITRKDEQQHRMELVTGGVLDFWTLDVDDPARGRKYARIMVDEAATVRNLKDKWEQAIRPTLTDFAGGALFGSTPKGRNYFQALDERSRTDPNRWASFHAPSSENPYLPPEEIEEARRELPELVFRQEYLAEYVDFAGAIIRAEWLHHGLPEGEFPIVVGVDLAISLKDEAAYTAMVAMLRDRPLGRVYILGALRFRATFHTIIERIIAFVAAIRASFRGPVKVCVEEVQFQAAVVQELLRRTKLDVRGVTPDKDKLTRFLPLAARYEKGMVFHNPDLPAYFTQELLALPVPDYWDQIDAASIAYAGLPAGQTTVASAGRRTF